MKLKNIIFDIGGVLAYPKSGHWFITNNFYDILDESLINKEELNKSLMVNLELQTQEPKNEDEEHKMFSEYYFKVLSDINYPYLTKDVSDRIANDCVFNDEKFVFYSDVRVTLERLCKNFNLYIISNGWPSSHRILKKLDLEKYFKGIIISSMFSSTKEEELFDIFLDKYQVNPKESLFIDDRRHILQKACTYGFELLLMDREKKYDTSKYHIINSLEQIDNFI